MGKGKINLSLTLDKIKSAFESVVDRGDKIVSIATNAGVAYLGYNALKHPAGALVGLLGLRLSQSPNLASGVAGIAALTGIGALNMIPPAGEYDPGPGHRSIEWVLEELQKRGLWKPSTPISETPWLKKKREIFGGLYISP